MLEKLYIKNYLIIKEAELSFSKGLNILTGETGAGKTIILDALGLILGERADYSIIKKDNEKLVVEGYFEFDSEINVEKYIKEKNLQIEEENYKTVIIRRELNKKGITRSFINDIPVGISELKEFGDIIIDIHSQNEHQSIIRNETHTEIVDNFLKDENELIKFKKLYNEYSEEVNKYYELIKKNNVLKEKIVFLEFQLKEINDINPSENEDNELSNNLKMMENSEEITSSINSALELLFEKDNNVLTEISLAIKDVRKLEKYDDATKTISNMLESGYETIKEATTELRRYLSSINFDHEKIEEIRTRLGAINFLKKKYNLTVNKLIDKAREIESELRFTEVFEKEIEKLKGTIYDKKESLIKASFELSKQRKTASAEIDKKVNKYLNEIGLENATFTTNQTNLIKEAEDESFIFIKDKQSIHISKNGIDDIEFMVMTNKGGEFTPLRKTASGGEVSRIMLAIKASLSDKDKIPVLVFDEIDAGISGKISGKVGKLLSQLSNTHQIIAITHLPQIAAMGDRNFYVSKKETKDETVAEIKQLNNEEKVTEIARLLSGSRLTEASVKNAKELIKEKVKQ